MRWINVLAAMAFVAAATTAEVFDCAEGRWSGRWVDIAATAYTPTNAIDSAYHESKGTRWRWILADGKTHAKRTPYGVAVKLFEGKDGKWRPALPFGTRIYIPLGSGYLDRSRTDERVFTVDDGSASSLYASRIDGLLHIDLRWVDTSDAVKWSGAEGHQVVRVFVIEQDLPRPVEPVVTWPVEIAEAALPRIPVAEMNEPQPQGSWWLVALLAIVPEVFAVLGLMVGLRR